MRLLSNNKETLTRLCNDLGAPEKVQELRNLYEQDSTNEFCDSVFTKMMLLDSCFIVFYIKFIFAEERKKYPELKSHQIVFLQQDLFLLENQIPFKGVSEVMKLLNMDPLETIQPFVYGNILAPGRPKRRWFDSIFYTRKGQEKSNGGLKDSDPDDPDHPDLCCFTKKIKDGALGLTNKVKDGALGLTKKVKDGALALTKMVKDGAIGLTKTGKDGPRHLTIKHRKNPAKRMHAFRNAKEESNGWLLDLEPEPDHLLHLLHRSLTKKVKVGAKEPRPRHKHDRKCTFRNVNELVDVGINFKPSDTMSMAHIEFTKWKYWFSADITLPPITVDDSTKPMLLNLIAYEMWSHDHAFDAVVTSYTCFLDLLIDHADDVKVLRKAGVIENSLGSDEQVAKLFNEIGTDIVPNNLAYLEAKNMIQRHYESRSNTIFAQFTHQYVNSPWRCFAAIGAVIALILGVLQVIYTIWSPKTECDDFCKFLKINHHL
ncbi:hypothetical protein QVD17_09358 [Tagetes erecta]|uniref:Uncharacterized protein n=1 Tax=Tagetes erecta TaxID=13708 RepID=A0AAD8L469_TARER|nr:hypothetical protein QVD17_09358 [Tagetes erecta]